MKALFGVLIASVCFGVSITAAAQTARQDISETGADIKNQNEQKNADRNNLDIIIVSGVLDKNRLAGSLNLLTNAELQQQNYTDINRILRLVPGLNLQEEDGNGLFPNIGIRGSGSDRSRKIMILEDGVPMAPALFSAPSAYYFPSAARMNMIETSKSLGAIKYGPLTSAGSVHFFSTPVPQKTSANIEAQISNFRKNAHIYAGGRTDLANSGYDIGFLVESWQEKSDGFKQVDFGRAGFEISDYIAKFGIYSAGNAGFDQSLELKYQYSEQEADETYLGLTREDFARNPFMRYRASQLDNFTSSHKTAQLTHNLEFGDKFRLTTIFYRTDTARNWQKLDRFDNSALSALAECGRLNEILQNPDICSQEFAVLRGADDYTSPDNVLGIRENNRKYFSQGVQTAIKAGFTGLGMEHNLTISVRAHKDEEDRFQQQDQYKIDRGRIIKTTDNAAGTQSNRVSNAKSLAVFAQDEIRLGDWDFIAGLRYEKISLKQLRYSGPLRARPAQIRKNDFDVFLYSFGASRRFGQNLVLLAGLSKGFAPPSPSSPDARPERSISYEFGGRYENGNFNLEAIGFFNDYANLLAECSNSAGGSQCNIGDNDNAGAANVYGLELSINADLAKNSAAFSIPLNLAYTYTNTSLLNAVDSDIFGIARPGDEIPYVPAHQLGISLGIVNGNWGVNTMLSATSAVRDQPGQGRILPDEKIPARALLDISVHYDISESIRLYVKSDNIFDKTYLAARRPYGLRPGKPREIYLGIRAGF